MSKVQYDTDAPENVAEPMRFESPLTRWPGYFTLPNPEEFTGAHWNLYRKSFDRAAGEFTSPNRHFCYSGLDLIKAAGEWKLDIPLAEVDSWRKQPEEERILLVSWIGNCISGYITGLVSPKE